MKGLIKRTIIFDGNINSENFDKFIKSFEDKEADSYDIYFTSPGGEYWVGEAFIDYLEKRKDKINLIGFKDISSTAFEIFFKLSCNKKLLQGTMATIHFPTIDIGTRESKKDNKTWYVKQGEMMKSYEKSWLNFYKSLGISEKYIKLIKKGEDVVLNTKELRKLLK